MAVTSEQYAGKRVGEVFRHLRTSALPRFTKIDDVKWDEIDLIICGLPHGKSQSILSKLSLRSVDLSADFRLRDEGVYQEWYGRPHQASELQKRAVYGLSEVYRREIETGFLIANPGCYPTAILLGLLPLVKEELLVLEECVIDAKSGVSGAGRTVNSDLQFCEINEGVKAYGVKGHRHIPEIEQEVSKVAGGGEVKVSFTPHLIPINRGMLITMYLKCVAGATFDDIYQALETAYKDERFVTVLPAEEIPRSQEVVGTNECWIGVCRDRLKDRVKVISALDNLLKGASGQAIQNVNIMHGWSESLGLDHLARAV